MTQIHFINFLGGIALRGDHGGKGTNKLKYYIVNIALIMTPRSDWLTGMAYLF